MEISLKQMIENLEGNQEKLILETITQIRRRGNGNTIVPLIECYFASDSKKVRSEIKQLFCDIKDKKVATIWADGLLKHIGGNGFSELVGCCWQSSISCHNEIMIFAEIMVKGDLYSCIEAITVIEQSLSNADENIRKKLINYLENHLNNMESDNYKLSQSFLIELNNNM
jgi:hypothetical protein